jgi:hypothetical protein
MSPAPLPVPHTFVGMVFDVQGALFEATVGAVVDFAHGRVPATRGERADQRSVWTATKMLKAGLASRAHAAPEPVSEVGLVPDRHPVDVASWRVLTTMPGLMRNAAAPLPLEWDAEYASSWSHRRDALGWGWNHPSSGPFGPRWARVVYQAEDGREIEFSTMDEPGHQA